MKIDFQYATDFLGMNDPKLSHTCMHLLCTEGEGSFVFNERCYHLAKNDLVVMPNPCRAKNLAAAPGMQVEWFAADYKFLQNLLPSNNYSIGGSISLNQDPVIKLTDEQAAIMLAELVMSTGFTYLSMLTMVYFLVPSPMASACSMVWVPCCLSMRFNRSVGSFLAVTSWLLMMSTQAWSRATGSVLARMP